MAYQLNALGISVLALLAERPMHGHEMFQTLTARHADRIAAVRPGLPYLGHRLVEEKLIRAVRRLKWQPAGQPDTIVESRNEVGI